nr:ligand-binding sensor domain-containing diguanylate cyclase [Thermomonas alba]
MLRGVALLLGLLITAPALALDQDKPYRDFVVDTWDVAQGLPQISVMAITQGPDGQLWLATQAGLARFDGVRFHAYPRTRRLGLDNMIQTLLPDRQGRVWLGTANGLQVLLPDGRLHELPAGQISAPRRFPVRALALQGQSVLVGGPDGLYVVTGERLRRLLAVGAEVSALSVEADALWIGSRGRVIRLDHGGRRQEYPFPDALATAAPIALARFDGELLAATRSGLLRLRRDGIWEAFPEHHGEQRHAVETMTVTHDGTLWLATPHFLERLVPGRAPERISDRPGSRNLRALFEDREGNLWTGSLTDGLARIWNGRTRRLSTAEGLRVPLLWTIVPAPDGSVLVGSSDGVARWDGRRFVPVATGAVLPHPDAYSLLAEPDMLWIGTRAGAAVLRSGHARPDIPPLLNPLRDAQVHAILRARDGALWFGTTNGAFRLAAGRLQRYGEAQGLRDPRVRILLQLSSGRLLLGTADGLYEWRAGRILPFGQQTGLPAGVGVTALLELRDGRLVLGGDDQLWLYADGRWHDLAHGRGLPGNVPTHLAQIGNDLWVAGTQGVYRLPLAALARLGSAPGAALRARIVVNSGFAQPGGQQDKCCNGVGNGRGLLRDGLLWLPTRDGVLQVSTRPAPVDPPWPLRIEEVRAGQQAFDAVMGTLTLPLDVRQFQIHFSAPMLDPARQPDLRYRLIGLDRGWTPLESPTQRRIGYTGLAPGRYTFELADFDPDAPLGGPARLALTVPAHFYESGAFRIALGLLGLLLIWLGYLWQRHRHARQRAELERLVEARTRELQDANAKLERLSLTDPLTGLHNRRYLTQQMPLDLSFYAREEAFRDGREALVLALLDVDHFKRINDTWGHAAGDHVLEQLGQLLKSLKRSGDYAARWGGEEFLLVLRPLPRGQLAEIGQRLCQQIAGHVFDLGNGQMHRLTVSIGLIECPLFPHHPQLLTWEQLVTLADRALYAAKAAGRNAWMAYRPAAGAQLPPDLTMAAGDPGWLIESGLLERIGGSCSEHATGADTLPPQADGPRVDGDPLPFLRPPMPAD